MAVKKKRPVGRPKGSKNKVPGKVTAQRRIRLQAIAEFVMAGHTTAEIAEKLRVGPSAIRVAMDSDRFQELLDACLEDRRKAVSRRLERLADTALDVHEEIMQDRAHRNRLNAAEGVLDRIGATQKGSLVRNEVKAVQDDFQGRTEADLEYYVKHGCWPEEDPKNEKPKKPQA